MQPAPAYFFGVRPGERSGHFLHEPGLHRVWSVPATPWGNATYPIMELEAIEATWGGPKRRYDRTQPEGEPRFARKDGWTLVALWDRSADTRGGCCALFAFQVEATDDEALALARELFPAVFARIEEHLGRPVRLAPACCPTCRRPLSEAAHG